MNRNCTSVYMSELLGTFLLVFIGCGSAVLAGSQIGFLGVSFAFGLTLTILAYSLGPVSGCHLNPAVTLMMGAVGRLPHNKVPGYIVAQLLGAALAGIALYNIAKGKGGFDISAGFALNGFGEHSPDNYNMISCLIAETIGTTVLLYVILSTTAPGFVSSFSGLVVGTTLTILHLILIPITNASLNIARSFGPAIMYGDWALKQLWLFAVAHLISIIIAIVLFKLTQSNR